MYILVHKAWDRGNGGGRCWRPEEREKRLQEIKPRKEYGVGLAANFQYIFALLAKQYFQSGFVLGLDASVMHRWLCCEALKQIMFRNGGGRMFQGHHKALLLQNSTVLNELFTITATDHTIVPMVGLTQDQKLCTHLILLSLQC